MEYVFISYYLRSTKRNRWKMDYGSSALGSFDDTYNFIKTLAFSVLQIHVSFMSRNEKSWAHL